MTTHAQQCRDEQLRLLLSEDDASDEYRAAADHVETCDSCQRRLASLAADASWWSHAQTLLSGDDEPRWTPDTSQIDAASDPAHTMESLHRTVKSLLATPGHPEMLGRLGRYDIERIIGSGGMGIVLKAHDSELNRPIAIKLLAPHLAHVGAARERFAREGRAAAAVVHEHVVAIYNVEPGSQVPFLVMQYVPGRSLQARVDEDGPLGVEEILRIGIQAASGLAAAHRQGLVHRDVKPSNILLENQVERAVLTDFGLARAIDDASLTQTGILAGTPHYMSPEQATGAAVDHRSDLFSLGAVLYFAATGHPPFRASGTLAVLHRICREKHRPVWQLNRDIPDELSDVIDRLLEKKPARRYASAVEVQEKLSALLSRVQQQGLGRRQFRGWRGKRLRRKLAAIAACLALVGATVGLGTWFEWPQAEQSSEHSVTSLQSAPQRSPPGGTASATVERDTMQLVEQEGRFFSDFKSLENSIGDDGSFYFQQGDDRWRRDLDILRRDVAELERSLQPFTNHKE